MRENSSQGTDKGDEIAQDGKQVKGMFFEENRCLDQTGIFFIPATENEKPMLHKCQQQFGVK
jgi:hypothetical protein